MNFFIKDFFELNKKKKDLGMIYVKKVLKNLKKKNNCY